ncbi:uncharacterized protein LOC115634668 [Scaptodrosophila lebanonensis]|uniref:Uncharacterized protein LOC115634668 n=1 Tax=Drosophila lebanonensis TaxID=7225 RepID=A0A6J2ULU2_DROLE|nr:uncharacterized protein LOC115634668 [Scaptodrosophila lebanonensis]
MPTLRLRLPSNRTLSNICVYGAVFSISAVMYMRWKLEDRVRNTEYYKLAMQTLRRHKGAVGLLGEPIRESGFDLSDANNTCDAQNAKFEVKVHGTKDKGTVFFWATNNKEKGWLIDRLELETKQQPNKRFLLKKSTDFTVPKNLDQESVKGAYAAKTKTNSRQAPYEKDYPQPHYPQPDYDRSGYQQPAEEYAQHPAYVPLQQNEPAPYIETADGGRML